MARLAALVPTPRVNPTCFDARHPWRAPCGCTLCVKDQTMPLPTDEKQKARSVTVTFLLLRAPSILALPLVTTIDVTVNYAASCSRS